MDSRERMFQERRQLLRLGLTLGAGMLFGRVLLGGQTSASTISKRNNEAWDLVGATDRILRIQAKRPVGIAAFDTGINPYLAHPSINPLAQNVEALRGIRIVDTISPPSGPRDTFGEHGHGTSTASIATAFLHGKGNTTLYNMNIWDTSTFNSAGLLMDKGLRRMIDDPAIQFGYNTIPVPGPQTEALIAEAHNAGKVFISTAGNDGHTCEDTSNQTIQGARTAPPTINEHPSNSNQIVTTNSTSGPVYPALYPYAISATAVDYFGIPQEWSNSNGKEKTERNEGFAAPGSWIYAADREDPNNPLLFSGTSCSTPFLAACMGLLVATTTDKVPVPEILAALIASSRPVTGCDPYFAGVGIPNIDTAAQMLGVFSTTFFPAIMVN
jgi:hypothetical protein